jgi:uridine kinase
MNLPQALASLVHESITNRAPPLLVALCGWADTGKSTVASQLCSDLGRFDIFGDMISTDSFMRDRAERNALGISGYNPRSIDIQALDSAISKFLTRESFAHYPYDNRTGTKNVRPRVVEPCDVLVVEGIHSFNPGVAKRMHLKVFIDADEVTLRQMRYRANMQKRGMKAVDAEARIESEWQEYCTAVRPLISSADLIVHVDESYNYRWPMSSGNPRTGSDLSLPVRTSDA